jgi:hypothetical protein
MKTIIGRPARAGWQNELIERLARSNALVIPALKGTPFTELFSVLFSRSQDDWRMDVSPRKPELIPSVVIIEALQKVLDRIQSSGWTRAERKGGVDSIWVDGRLRGRQVVVHVCLGAPG